MPSYFCLTLRNSPSACLVECWLGQACEVDPLDPEESDMSATDATEESMSGSESPEPSSIETSELSVKSFTSGLSTESRKEMLTELLAEVGPTLSSQDRSKLFSMLSELHHAFFMEDEERGGD